MLNKKPKRCIECGKQICLRNKSDLYGYHNRIKKHLEKRRSKCRICGEKCSGKLLITWKKNSMISVCQRHFNKLNQPWIITPQQLRQEINRLKSLH